MPSKVIRSSYTPPVVRNNSWWTTSSTKLSIFILFQFFPLCEYEVVSDLFSVFRWSFLPFVSSDARAAPPRFSLQSLVLVNWGSGDAVHRNKEKGGVWWGRCCEDQGELKKQNKLKTNCQLRDTVATSTEKYHKIWQFLLRIIGSPNSVLWG